MKIKVEPTHKNWPNPIVIIKGLAFLFLVIAPHFAEAQTTCTPSSSTACFTFTLDEPSKTSAGVYLSDGTLIRTLWSKQSYYAAGTYTATWDGNEDSPVGGGTPRAAQLDYGSGPYTIKLLQHNTDYGNVAKSS